MTGPVWRRSRDSDPDRRRRDQWPEIGDGNQLRVGILVTWLRAQLDKDELVARARHDPARALREVEAKRRILDGCLETLAAEDAWDPQLEGGSGEEFVLARFTVQMLTLPYSDRPGYRDEWRP